MLSDTFYQQDSLVSVHRRLWIGLLTLLIAAQSILAVADPHPALEPAYQHFAQQSVSAHTVESHGQHSHLPHINVLHDYDDDHGCEHFHGVQLLHLPLFPFSFHVPAPVIEVHAFVVEVNSVVVTLLLRPPIA